MPEIKLTNITKRWGKFYAVDNLNLTIEDNSFITLLGPSGCGKTTTLRMIAGLETPTSGRIEIGGRVVFDSEEGINVPANKRKVGFLFQNYALWPNMTVYENIAFGLSNIKEELPKYDFEAKTIADQIRALESGAHVAELTRECFDKKGKLDMEKARLKLIDSYTISIYTAKKLLSYGLNEEQNPSLVAERYGQELKEKLEVIRDSYRKKGKELNRDCAITSNGKIETEVRKLHKEEIDLAVRRVSRIVKIGMFMDRYPAELSGGQQQRVAIARTLAPEPEVLFMDEPLSNLDAKLRLEMRYELQRLHVETGSTFVYVTHDQMEAMTLATKICLINNGVLQQYEAPLTVYNRPKNLFVADFVGNPSINFVDAKGTQQEDGAFLLEILDGKKVVFRPNEKLDLRAWIRKHNQLEMEKSLSQTVEKGNKDERFRYHIQRVNEEEDCLREEPVITDQDFVIGIRPECLALSQGPGLEGEIYGAMPTGMESTLKLRVGEFLFTGVVFGGVTYSIGEKTNLTAKGSDILLYDRKAGDFITAGTLEIL